VRLSALGLRNEDPLAKLSLLPSMPEGLRKLSLFSTKPPLREDAP